MSCRWTNGEIYDMILVDLVEMFLPRSRSFDFKDC